MNIFNNSYKIIYIFQEEKDNKSRENKTERLNP